jgi:hypothetical protein
METNLNTLTVLAEVTIAFVAFAAIIATLKRTFGEQLSPLPEIRDTRRYCCAVFVYECDRN